MARLVGALGIVLACSCASAKDPGARPAPDAAAPASEADAAAPPTPTTPDASAPAPSFAVLSLNLHCLKTSGTAFATNDERFTAIAAAAHNAGVDVILAQEVCEKPGTSSRELLTAALEKETGARWSSASALAHKAWEGTPDEADEHVAVFARGELANAKGTVHRTQSALARVMIGATVEAPSTVAGTRTRVRVVSIHLDHADATVRAAQAREVASAAMIEAEGEAIDADGATVLPVLVAGDFNARDGSDALGAMKAFGFVEASGSAGSTRIDHVFVHRSAPLAPADHQLLFTGADAVSDHPGILARFTASAGTPVRLTRVIAAGAQGSLYVRGNAPPLDWVRGWPAFPRGAAGEVALVTSEIPAGAFAFKFLRGDVDWQIGEDAAGAGQADTRITPVFP